VEKKPELLDILIICSIDYGNRAYKTLTATKEGITYSDSLTLTIEEA
jgi:hypothetical protein